MASLFVARVGSLTVEELESAFGEYGELMRCELKGRFAFITFYEYEAADRALKGLHGSELKDTKLLVEWSKDSGRYAPSPDNPHYIYRMRQQQQQQQQMDDPNDQFQQTYPAKRRALDNAILGVNSSEPLPVSKRFTPQSKFAPTRNSAQFTAVGAGDVDEYDPAAMAAYWQTMYQRQQMKMNGGFTPMATAPMMPSFGGAGGPPPIPPGGFLWTPEEYAALYYAHMANMAVESAPRMSSAPRRGGGAGGVDRPRRRVPMPNWEPAHRSYHGGEQEERSYPVQRNFMNNRNRSSMRNDPVGNEEEEDGGTGEGQGGEQWHQNDEGPEDGEYYEGNGTVQAE